MAMKKIRIDFSKVEERSGWNTRQIPEGLHKMKIESVQQTEATDGTDMLVYALKPTDGRYKSRLFPYYCKLQQNQYWKLRDLLVAAGQKVPKSAANIDPSAIVGKYIAGEVEDESNQQYAGRSVVNGTYGLDILEDSADSSEPDEDEEEYEDEEDSEGEEEDKEEDEDDLSTLTLPELRKLAKSLGVTTTGLKQDDLIEAIEEAQSEGDDEEEDDLDEDDLEDEELEDEEFEDDEEEEEPAPARRRPAAKATPAKRTAAPARRKVARR